jgi:hypothetical protein
MAPVSPKRAQADKPGPATEPYFAHHSLPPCPIATQIFGFLGINGAGKTTTLSMLTGDALPTSGSARMAGFDILKEQPAVRRLLGYCPQFDSLLELMTVKEHLEVSARCDGDGARHVSSWEIPSSFPFVHVPLIPRTTTHRARGASPAAVCAHQGHTRAAGARGRPRQDPGAVPAPQPAPCAPCPDASHWRCVFPWCLMGKRVCSLL